MPVPNAHAGTGIPPGGTALQVVDFTFPSGGFVAPALSVWLIPAGDFIFIVTVSVS